MHVVIIADDLTGAADAAAPFTGAGLHVSIHPWDSGAGGRPYDDRAAGEPSDVVVIETDSRDLGEREAARRMQAVCGALPDLPARTWRVKKIDSQLRGPIGVELAVLRDALGRPPTVVAPAFPRMGRTTVAGVQHLGPPATASDPRAGSPTRSVREACQLPDAVLVGASGTIPVADASVVDASDDSDLDHLVRQLLDRRPRPLLVGSGGLTQALARSGLPTSAPPPPPTVPEGPVVVVSLSPSPVARRQVAQLLAHEGTTEAGLELTELLRAPGTAVERVGAVLRRTSDRGTTVVTLRGSPPDGLDAGELRAAVLSCVTATLRTAPEPALAVGNGGDATRCIVDAWGRGRLDVLRELGHGGAALVRARDGLLLVTKSGGFGNDSGLLDLLAEVDPPGFRTPTRPREATS